MKRIAIFIAIVAGMLSCNCEAPAPALDYVKYEFSYWHYGFEREMHLFDLHVYPDKTVEYFGREYIYAEVKHNGTLYPTMAKYTEPNMVSIFIRDKKYLRPDVFTANRWDIYAKDQMPQGVIWWVAYKIYDMSLGEFQTIIEKDAGKSI